MKPVRTFKRWCWPGWRRTPGRWSSLKPYPRQLLEPAMAPGGPHPRHGAGAGLAAARPLRQFRGAGGQAAAVRLLQGRRDPGRGDAGGISRSTPTTPAASAASWTTRTAWAACAASGSEESRGRATKEERYCPIAKELEKCPEVCTKLMMAMEAGTFVDHQPRPRDTRPSPSCSPPAAAAARAPSSWPTSRPKEARQGVAPDHPRRFPAGAQPARAAVAPDGAWAPWQPGSRRPSKLAHHRHRRHRDVPVRFHPLLAASISSTRKGVAMKKLKLSTAAKGIAAAGLLTHGLVVLSFNPTLKDLANPQWHLELPIRLMGRELAWLLPTVYDRLRRTRCQAPAVHILPGRGGAGRPDKRSAGRIDPHDARSLGRVLDFEDGTGRGARRLDRGEQGPGHQGGALLPHGPRSWRAAPRSAPS